MFSFLTYFHITFVINHVIMVNWFDNSQLFFYLVGGRYLNVFPGFSLDSYFDLSFPYVRFCVLLGASQHVFFDKFP
jgi:hypothetical protein